MVVRDESGKIYFSECSTTENAWERFVGLLNKKSLKDNECLWIQPCNSIHTFFMKFSIDAAFLDSEGKVVAIYENLSPWRMSGIHFSAKSVLETAAGELRKRNIEKGRVLKICQPS